MVHGIQALHAMRSVTKELSKTPTARLSSVDAALNATKAESPVAARAFEHAAPAVARARTHIERLTLNAQRPSPSLLSSMVQGVQALRALRGVTHAMKSAPRGSAMGHTHAPASPSMRPGPADSAMATAPQGPGEHSLSTFPTQGA